MLPKLLISVLMVPVIYLLIAFVLTLIAPSVSGSKSLNFAQLANGEGARVEQSQLHSFTARDGSAISYAHYPAATDLKVILLHGSGYHGGYLNTLAEYLSSSGAADVYVPNVRGHWNSGDQRGDIAYIGQLEDDLVDLIELIKNDDADARIVIGGHSSGGALAMRFAASEHAAAIANFFTLAPFLGPDAPTLPKDDSGWAHISLPRIIGLSMLNNVGIHWLDYLPTIKFNLPEPYRDGSETLDYSWRLMMNFAVHKKFRQDIASLPETSLTLVGRDDEAVDASAFPKLFNGLQRDVKIVDGHDHFSLILDRSTHEHIAEWLREQP